MHSTVCMRTVAPTNTLRKPPTKYCDVVPTRRRSDRKAEKRRAPAPPRDGTLPSPLPSIDQAALEEFIRFARASFIANLPKRGYNREDLNEAGPLDSGELAVSHHDRSVEGGSVPHLPPEELVRQTQEVRESLLQRMGYVVTTMDELRSVLDKDVENARLLGVTWADIARSVGVTPQAAYRRWDPEGKRKINDYRRKARGPAGPESTTGDDL